MTTVHGDWIQNFQKQFVPRLHCAVSVYNTDIRYPLDIAETYIDAVEMNNTFAELSTALPSFSMKITLNNVDGAFNPNTANYINYLANPRIVKVQFSFDANSYMDPLYGNAASVSFNTDETKVYLLAEIVLTDMGQEVGFPLDRTGQMWTENTVTLSALLRTMYNNRNIGYHILSYTAADTDAVTLPFPIRPNRPDVALQEVLFGAGWEMQINRSSTLSAATYSPYLVPELHGAVNVRESELPTDDPITDYFISASELQSYPVQNNGGEYVTFSTSGKTFTAASKTIITNTLTFNYSFDNAVIINEIGGTPGMPSVIRQVIWLPFDTPTVYAYASVQSIDDSNVSVRNYQTSPYGVYLQAYYGLTIPDGTITVQFYGTLVQTPYINTYNLVNDAKDSIAFTNDYGMPSSALLADYITHNTTFSFSWWADPRLEAGDYVILKTKKTSVLVRILSINYVYNGAMKATATARFVADYGNLSLYADDELHLIDYATPV